MFTNKINKFYLYAVFFPCLQAHFLILREVYDTQGSVSLLMFLATMISICFHEEADSYHSSGILYVAMWLQNKLKVGYCNPCSISTGRVLYWTLPWMYHICMDILRAISLARSFAQLLLAVLKLKIALQPKSFSL